MHLRHEFDRRIRSEWILVGMTGDIGGRMTSKTLTDAVENEYGRAIVVSLDDVPGLGDTEAGNPAGQRRRNLGKGGIKPPLWWRSGSSVPQSPP